MASKYQKGKRYVDTGWLVHDVLRGKMIFIRDKAKAPDMPKTNIECGQSKEENGVRFRCFLEKGHDGPHDFEELASQQIGAIPEKSFRGGEPSSIGGLLAIIPKAEQVDDYGF